MIQFFRKIFASSSTETDLSFGLITQLGIGQLDTDSQWARLETIAAALAPDDLTRLLDSLCLSRSHASALQRYLTTGHSELRQLLAGGHHTFLAWESRGTLVASATTREQVDGFYYYLTKAFDDLSQPFKKPAFQAEAAARLVRVAMGLGKTELAQGAFESCISWVPTHLMGHFNYMRVVSPWWHGSIADLIKFVDAITDPALHRLFQIIYLNEAHSFSAHEQNSDAAATKLLEQDYRSRLDAVLAGPAVAVDNSLAAAYYNNYLAGLHYILGNKAARNKLIQTLGPNITPYPWSYFGLTTAAAVQSLLKS